MSGSKRNESVPNQAVRERFERLAVLHGREQLAEHVGIRLGWNVDQNDLPQEPHQYRRGLFVALGLAENRHSQTSDTISGHWAAKIHAILDEVEAGGELAREAAEAIPPAHRTAVGPSQEGAAHV